MKTIKNNKGIETLIFAETVDIIGVIKPLYNFKAH